MRRQEGRRGEGGGEQTQKGGSNQLGTYSEGILPFRLLGGERIRKEEERRKKRKYSLWRRERRERKRREKEKKTKKERKKPVANLLAP